MSVPILGAENTPAGEGTIILFSEGLESTGEAGIGCGFIEVDVCLQSKLSALKEKDAPVRACRSETEFSVLCLERHTSRSCEQDPEDRTRERLRCADGRTGVKDPWRGRGFDSGGGGKLTRLAWPGCTETSGGGPQRVLLMLCSKGSGKCCLLYEGISKSNPWKV